MNKIEQLKAEKDGLEIVKEIPEFAHQGWEAISEGDLERLKWSGLFFRKHTPGFFMMRVRITSGITYTMTGDANITILWRDKNP